MNALKFELCNRALIWLWLPQEDFCQVMGVPSHLKYESDGGPGLSDIAGVLKGSAQAEKDLTTLLTTQLLFWMLAAPDGHAKNFSIRVLPQGRYQLTPLYDVMSIWPVEGNGPNQFSMFKAKMAMAVMGKNKHYLFKDIQRRHFNNMATPRVIESMTTKLPKGFPNWIAESVFNGLRATAGLLERMPAS